MSRTLLIDGKPHVMVCCQRIIEMPGWTRYFVRSAKDSKVGAATSQHDLPPFSGARRIHTNGHSYEWTN